MSVFVQRSLVALLRRVGAVVIGALVLASAVSATYSIKWQVVSAGGTDASYSTIVRLRGTFHQTAVASRSGAYDIMDGFWPYAQSLGPCCIGTRGNIDGDPQQQVTTSDLTFLAAYLFQGGPAPSCTEEADVNGDGLVNITDQTYLVAYLFQGGPAPIQCP